jgi:hypothetical protein
VNAMIEGFLRHRGWDWRSRGTAEQRTVVGKAVSLPEPIPNNQLELTAHRVVFVGYFRHSFCGPQLSQARSA